MHPDPGQSIHVCLGDAIYEKCNICNNFNVPLMKGDSNIFLPIAIVLESIGSEKHSLWMVA